ncbi:universal stress protein [Amycolatopsis umgeniensis]|uniref:Nucleotide-binding universal stress UspA family protein n=1 Tax=Amycolatopsis umgeniensis TaxID=336628 RepID=A0A841AR56_9PSEU|nr:universal stress protein [Amycolatopsis umgeniensis]MBB5850376.1 nucleotide-binding universal stress UspA family protein [Amycolatopsis umgeniensis]
MTGIQRRADVVVGVDSSQSSRAAVRWAAGEAARRDSTLKLLHIDGRRWESGAAQDNLTAASVAKEAEPAVPTEHEVKLGEVAGELVAASRSASLLVLGTHGFGALRGAPIGAVAAEVAGHAGCPVVVVRGLTAPRRGEVVVGVDPSGASERALAFALDGASARNTDLVVVHAWHDGVLEAGAELASVEAAEERALEDRMAAWRDKYPGVGLRLAIVRDRNVARALIRVVPHAGLIVIGSSGGGLGSTAQALLGRARCPVALVGGPARG